MEGRGPEGWALLKAWHSEGRRGGASNTACWWVWVWRAWEYLILWRTIREERQKYLAPSTDSFLVVNGGILTLHGRESSRGQQAKLHGVFPGERLILCGWRGRALEMAA